MSTRISRALLLATLLAGLMSTTAVAPPPARAANVPDVCADPSWTYLEVHTWWEGAPLAAGQIAHLHAESCVPLGQTVSGTITMNTRIVMMDNPGHLFRYESALFDHVGAGGDVDVVGMDATCSAAPPQHCEWWVQTTLDTNTVPDGWHEIRVKPRVELSNGDVMLTSAGWPVCIRSCAGGNADIVGRGWYDRGHEYQNSVFRGDLGLVMPGATVSGTWSPTVRLDAGSGGHPTTFTAAYIDSNHHIFDEESDGGGVGLFRNNGPFRGTLNIDTSRLSNGRHELVLRTDARQPDGRLTGLQYIPFVVGGSTTPATPPSSGGGHGGGHHPAPPAAPRPPSTPSAPTTTPAAQGGGLPFGDIAASPFLRDIVWLAQSGITGGCSSRPALFCGSGAVTRGQMASFLSRALKLPATRVDYFDDDDMDLHEPSINRLAAAGITGGCATDRFCPNTAVTREQMASFLVRALGLRNTSRDYYGDDRGIHERDINRLAASGITGGCATKRFCPHDSVTREQMAAFLRRALTR